MTTWTLIIKLKLYELWAIFIRNLYAMLFTSLFSFAFLLSVFLLLSTQTASIGSPFSLLLFRLTIKMQEKLLLNSGISKSINWFFEHFFVASTVYSEYFSYRKQMHLIALRAYGMVCLYGWVRCFGCLFLCGMLNWCGIFPPKMEIDFLHSFRLV